MIESLKGAVGPLRDRLIDHPIYGAIGSHRALCCFMEHHVFAVWDFMTLLKGLQRELTCVDLPWVPPSDPAAARLINEIVLAEESDVDEEGNFLSHFEMYLDAMRSAGADTGPIDRFIESIRRGEMIDDALEAAEAPESARAFVRTTWSFIESGSVAAIASAFTVGREDLLPDLFRGLVAQIAEQEPARVGPFLRYLDRHVHLDGDEHGPMATRMLRSICGSDASRVRDARYAATVALEARLALWDDVHSQIVAEAPVA